jgi:hypothetical protein
VLLSVFAEFETETEREREREISCADLLQNLNINQSQTQPTNQASNKTLPHSKTNTNISKK